MHILQTLEERWKVGKVIPGIEMDVAYAALMNRKKMSYNRNRGKIVNFRTQLCLVGRSFDRKSFQVRKM